MALVRRTSAIGRATVPGATVPIPPPAIPHQPGAPISPPVAAAGVAPVPPVEEAASEPTLPAHPGAVLGGLVAAVAGVLSAKGINNFLNQPVLELDSQTSAYAALVAFSAATERILEPISRWMPGRRAQQRYERALADMENGVRGATQAAARAKAEVDRAKASRGVLMWGIATGVTTALAAGSGFYILHILAANPDWNAVPKWLDALVTGLIVGSFTKPLHDVVTRVQRSKDATNGH
jgi:hypothetical protein